MKRELKVAAYLRYMDDFVLFGNDPVALAAARSSIAAWLDQERRLTLNPKRWDVVPTTHPGIFLGYRMSRSGISPSRKLRCSMSRRLRRAAEQGYESLVCSLKSYRGLLLF